MRLALLNRLYSLRVERVSATELKKTGYAYNFFKCAPVDGLKLEGAWSSVQGWSKDLYYKEPGCRQVIYFKMDGTFDNRGIFRDCRYPDRDLQNAPGKGRYAISNFTLTLNYDDGRVVQWALTGVGNKNPATENTILYIGTNPVYIN